MNTAPKLVRDTGTAPGQGHATSHSANDEDQVPEFRPAVRRMALVIGVGAGIILANAAVIALG